MTHLGGVLLNHQNSDYLGLKHRSKIHLGCFRHGRRFLGQSFFGQAKLWKSAINKNICNKN